MNSTQQMVSYFIMLNITTVVTLGLGHSASKPKGVRSFVTRVVFHVFLRPE